MAANNTSAELAINTLDDCNILNNIFAFLEIEDICRAAQVRVAWRNAARNPEFWKKIDTSNRQVSPQILRNLLLRHPEVEDLNAGGVNPSSEDIALVLPTLTGLHTLVLDKSTFTVADLQLISTHLPALTSLTLGECTIVNAVGDPPAEAAAAAEEEEEEEEEADAVVVAVNDEEAEIEVIEIDHEEHEEIINEEEEEAALIAAAEDEDEFMDFMLQQRQAGGAEAEADHPPELQQEFLHEFLMARRHPHRFPPHHRLHHHNAHIINGGGGGGGGNVGGNVGGDNGMFINQDFGPPPPPHGHPRNHVHALRAHMRLRLHQQHRHGNGGALGIINNANANNNANNQNNNNNNNNMALHWRTPRVTHPTLRSLTLRTGTAASLCIQCPHLTSLTVDHFSCQNYFLLATDRLESVHVEGGSRSHERDVRCLMGIQRNGDIVVLPSLRRLSFHESGGLSDDVVQKIAIGQTNVTSLELSKCGSFSGAGLSIRNGWQSLVKLSILDCDCLTGQNLSHAIEHMGSLRELTIKGCALISSLSIMSRSLHRLRLIAPTCLTALEVDATYLEEFALEPVHPTRPAAAALRSLSLNANAMQQLRIAACPVLTTATLGCAELEELEFVDCEQLSGHTITSIGRNGALPELRKLTLIECRSVRNVTLVSATLNALKIVTGSDMVSLELQCVSLASLSLQECPHLRKVAVQSLMMTDLELGSCPSVTSIDLNIPRLDSLNLRGCNQLREVGLRCANLKSINALLCSSLTDAALATIAKCTTLQELHIGACCEVSPAGIATLAALQHLDVLDLSYMPLMDPAPLLPAALPLSHLSLTDNYAMDTDALRAMLRVLYSQSSSLVHLDVSYCKLPLEAAAELALGWRIATSTGTGGGGALCVNGCQGAAHRLWPLLHRKQSSPSELRSLSLVKSQGLDVFYLGLVPVAGAHAAEILAIAPSPASEEENTKICITNNNNNNNKDNDDEVYYRVPTPLSNLEDLRLGLGEFTTIAIALPHLQSLELNNCLSLEKVTLLCPKLTRLSLAVCQKMTVAAIVAAVEGCPVLEYLDLGHCPLVSGDEVAAVAAIRRARPSLQTIDARFVQQHVVFGMMMN